MVIVAVLVVPGKSQHSNVHSLMVMALGYAPITEAAGISCETVLLLLLLLLLLRALSLSWEHSTLMVSLAKTSINR